ncbi:MAG: Sua5/YciO/YrdC/YwlC family protein [Pseudohongiellaceae bacterium]
MSRLHGFIAADMLDSGGIVAYPTEAVWGIGCDPFQVQAVLRILQIKQRPVEKGLILVASSTDQLGRLYSSLDKLHKRTLDADWPGPVTWLLPDPEDLVPWWIKGLHRSVAVRVSAHPVVRDLCEIFGGPVISTSANLAGEPAIRSRLKLVMKMGAKLDYIMPGTLGGASAPSPIRDLLTGSVLRAG